MPKLKDKFTLSKSSQIISLRFKKNKLWVNLSNLMSHQVSHDYSADKSLTDYKFCDIFLQEKLFIRDIMKTIYVFFNILVITLKIKGSS